MHETLESFLRYLGPPNSREGPCSHHDKDAGLLHYFSENVPTYGVWVSGEVTLHRSFQDDSLVGFTLAI